MSNRNPKFQSSINIRFDLGEEDFINRFLPTTSHIAPFKGILNGILGGTKSHIISGPYGSGKSLISTIITAIISKKYNNDVLMNLIEKFNVVDDQIGVSIKNVVNNEIKYIPVILEGNVHNFRKALISSIYKALKNDGTPLVLPSLIVEIISMVKKWEIEFPATYSLFIQQLNNKNFELASWITLIENCNEAEILWFSNIYPTLTSGSPFVPSFSGELVSQVNHILSELKKVNKGLFIVHDEFGRFLQSINPSEVHEAMQDLQDIAELADHNSFHNLSILLITHKNMRQYAHRFHEDLQKEFQRIEKRYSLYSIESDQSTFVRISHISTQHMREQWDPEKDKINLWNGLTRYSLFPELSQYEQTALIVEGCYPLHPISLFCMPKLANIVAQNERTLFTFLESNESGGLNNHYEIYNDWYTTDGLFDYFEPAFDEFEQDSNIKESYLLYKRLQKRLIPSKYLKDQLKILKLLTLWDIANLNIRVIPNLDFISYALLLTLEETQDRLDELFKLKVLRYMNDENRFILYEGSVVDVNKEIGSRLRSSIYSVKQKLEMGNKLLESKYYLPKLYNDEKSITRFAEVTLAHLSDISGEGNQIKHSKEADLNIIFIVTDIVEEVEAIKKKVDELTSSIKNVIFVTPNGPSKGIFGNLEKLLIIESLEQDKVFLIQDRFLIDELAYLKRSLLHNITTELTPYLNFTSDCEWIYDGNTLNISDERSLSSSLSKIMYKLYPFTPEVRNESFNRRNIAKVQEKGAYKVIDKIIESIQTNKEEIEISGFGPDYLIYATVLKNNRIHPLKPEELQDESLLQLREDLLTVLNQEQGPFTDLLDVLRNRPFAVRLPIIPLLLPALIGYKWKYLLFYNNDIFIKSINGELLWKMVSDPSNYTFVYQSIEGKYNELIPLVDKCFSSYIYEEDRGLQTPVYVSNILVRWYQSISRLSRISTKQSLLSNQLREIIRICEVRPLDAMERLLEFTNGGQGSTKIESAKVESEQYISMKHEKIIEKVIFAAIDIKSYSDLLTWAEGHSKITRKTSKLISSILTSDSVNYIDAISQSLVGVRREDWSDATDEVFETELSNELNNIKNQDTTKDYIEFNLSKESIVLSKVELSRKSHIIYDDIKRKLKYTGRNVTSEELLIILWKLMKDISKADSSDAAED
ncbi:hypothetical protein J2T13_002888 [Paenibacillus sp. DS2015]|uniref:hypothetical protein n=1 Tax=Paenibacillus sp. DS2015 TaxID=3373917 RepID=UPI003D211831